MFMLDSDDNLVEPYRIFNEAVQLIVTVRFFSESIPGHRDKPEWCGWKGIAWSAVNDTKKRWFTAQLII